MIFLLEIDYIVNIAYFTQWWNITQIMIMTGWNQVK